MDEINNNKAQRLSKLQKWILIRTYRKTIMAYTDGYVLFETYGYRKVNYDTNKRNLLKPRYELRYRVDLTWDYLFRNEILFNYFNRRMPKVRKRGIRIPHRFKGRGNKEQVILTHSVYNLRDKGLITIHNGFYTGWQGYRLTPKGIEVAKSLIINTGIY